MEKKEISLGLKIVRWIVLLPASVVVHLLIYWGNILLGKLWLDSSFAIDIMATMLANFGTPIIAAKIAPNYRKVVFVILCLLNAVLTGFNAYITIINPNTASTKLIILQIVGVISAICPIMFVGKVKEEDFENL